MNYELVYLDILNILHLFYLIKYKRLIIDIRYRLNFRNYETRLRGVSFQASDVLSNQNKHKTCNRPFLEQRIRFSRTTKRTFRP